jgi:hypothetical protein
MKHYVIAIPDHEGSQTNADRCIESGKRYGVQIEKFDAITPETHDVEAIFKQQGISTSNFSSKYSKWENVLACFLSHYTLWQSCTHHNQPYTIFEHDAVINAPLPEKPPMFVGSFGKPSYGKFETPSHLGWGELTSKPYFPGAHAYTITPIGGHMLCLAAKYKAAPTDVFLDKRRFEWLQEYYPWSAYVDDSFSTVQKVEGCLAKHNFNSEFDYLEE